MAAKNALEPGGVGTFFTLPISLILKQYGGRTKKIVLLVSKKVEQEGYI